MRFHPAMATVAIAVLAVAWTARSAHAQDDGATEEPAGAPAERMEDDDDRTFWIGGRAGAWLHWLDVEAEVGTAGLSGTADDLDLDGFAPGPYAEVFVETRYVTLHGDYWRVQREGDGTARREIRFGGIAVGADVDFESELDILSAGGRLTVWPLSWRAFGLGVSAGARYFRLEGEVRVADDTLSADDRIEGPIPFVGLALRLSPSEDIPIQLFAHANVFQIDELEHGDQQTDVRYLDGEAGLLFGFHESVAAFASYRLLFLDVDQVDDDDEADVTRSQYEIKQHGPVVGLLIRF